MDCIFYNKATHECSALKETKCEHCPFYKHDTKSKRKLNAYYYWWLKNVSHNEAEDKRKLIKAGLLGGIR